MTTVADEPRFTLGEWSRMLANPTTSDAYQRITRLGGSGTIELERLNDGQPTQLYAISDGDSVKIGTSRNPEQRLRQMRVDNPRELHLLVAVPATTALERRVHAVLWDERIRGEWFHRGPRVSGFLETLAVIADVCADMEADDETPDVEDTIAALHALRWEGFFQEEAT